MRKKFILGVGCQKGGTTWIRDQLQKNKQCDFGFKKEYHVFDRLFIPEMINEDEEDYLFRKITNNFSFVKDFLIKPNKNIPNTYKRNHFLLDTKNYFDYFDSLFIKNSLITTTGDITPSYSALPVKAYKLIKESFEKKGIKTKVIFIMRDPIERCWSQTRMIINFFNMGLYPKKFSNREIIKILKRRDNNNLDSDLLNFLYDDWRFKIRTRYEETINNLEEVFKSEDIFYALYENLFENETLERLKHFLDINDLCFDVKKFINTSPKQKGKNKLDNKIEKKIYYFYEKTYLFCDKRFKTKGYWKNFG